MSKKLKLIDLESHDSNESTLNVISFQRHLPFDPQRIFYVLNNKVNEIRGEHAHKDCWQFLVPMYGAVEVYTNDGKEEKVIILENKNQGLLLPPMVWSKQTYKTNDNILLVITSHDYDPDDYIHNFDNFLIEASK